MNDERKSEDNKNVKSSKHTGKGKNGNARKGYEGGPRTRRMARRKKPWYKNKKYISIMAAVLILAAFAAVFGGIYLLHTPSSVTENTEKEQETEQGTLNTDDSAASTSAAGETKAAPKDNNTVKEDKDTAKEDNKAAKEAEKILKTMTLEEKINQMFFITPEALTNVGNVIAAGEQTKNSLEKHPVGGIIYFSPNFTDEAQAKEMIANTQKFGREVCKVPLFIGVDEEGGTVARLANSEGINVPKVGTMAEIGASGNADAAYNAGSTIGKYLKEYGFNIDFAPVADVLTNELNQVVKDRSFGNDPNVVSQMALQVSKGLNDNGISSCYKHFPGHGATKDDTHEGFAYTNKNYDELMASEMVPFVQAIKNGADMIMVGHFSLPNVTGDNTCASISPVIINDILKTRLGYKGLVITDSLAMGALTDIYTSDVIAVRAIKAGVDILLMPQDFELAYNGVLNAVRSGEISEERIDSSVLKIIEKKLRL